jgi:uncharacterized protein (TIGR03435 family)
MAVAIFVAALVLNPYASSARSRSLAQAPPASTPAAPGWETTAGGKMEFEVASVRENKSNDKANADFPMGPGDVYAPTGGLFRATGMPLIAYIQFAFKITSNQGQYLRAGLPDWVMSDRFNIEARAENQNPTKDQMRLMMQSLLADRFKLAFHRETKQVPVYGLVLVKPGKTGPQLLAHPADSGCSNAIPQQSASGSEPPPPATTGRFPSTCGGIVGVPPSAPGRLSLGARNVTIGLIATAFSGAETNVDRPIVDRTGLSGTFDFALEFSPDPSSVPPGASFQPDASGPTFMQALKEQLGLKLEPQKSPIDVVIVDHVEHPSEN